MQIRTPEDAGRWGGLAWLLKSRSAMLAIAAVYSLIGLILVFTQYTLNDEGLLTHHWARWLPRDFSAVFFFQKLKPVLCLVYALPASVGIRATMLAHVVVAATAVPLMAATARALGHRLPNVAALVVAFSPVYFLGGSAGLANNDGVVGIALVLYLLSARRQPFAAGVIAGMLPWVRAELATFTAVIAVYALFTPRDRKFWIGMVLFPLLYGVAGSAYHGDVLWMQHYPPAAPADPDNPMWSVQPIGFRYLLEPALAVTPLAALALALRVKGLARIEQALIAYTVLSVMTINVFPIFRIGNFGTAPRYLLHILPALALFIGRTMERCWDQRAWPSARVWGAMGLTACWMATRQADQQAVTILLVAYVLVLALAWLRNGKLVVALATLMAILGPLIPLRTEVIQRDDLHSVLAWLASQGESSHGRIYTNSHLLGPYLEHRLPDVEVYDLGTPELVKELIAATNPDNGQRAAILRLCTSDLFGKMLLPPITPDDLGNGAVLALREDARVRQLLPEATWSNRLQVVLQSGNFRIARVVPPAAEVH